PEAAADRHAYQAERRQHEERDGGATACPLHDPLEAADGSRENRLAIEKSLQIVCQVEGAGVTPLRILKQAFEANDFQIARHAGIQARRSSGPLANDLTLGFGG